MDALASSHTMGSRNGRHLLIMFVALVLICCSIVAVAVDESVSGNLQDMGGVSKDSLARLQIWTEQNGQNGLLHRIGSEGTSQAAVRPPAIGMRRVEVSWRRMLVDVSPPGMWPNPADGQDGTRDDSRLELVKGERGDEFRRPSLPMFRTSPLPLASLFSLLSSHDGEDAFLHQALVADKTYPLLHLALIVNKVKQLASSTAISRSSLLGFRIRLPGFVRENAVAAKENSEQIQHGDQHTRTISGRIVAPDAVGTSPDHTLDREMLSRTGNFEASISFQQNHRVQETKFRSRSLLQADISPPGLWPDADDDES